MGLGAAGDLIWMMYWIPFWHSAEMAKWNAGLHSVVILSAFGGFLLKLIILVALTGFVTKMDIANKARF